MQRTIFRSASLLVISIGLCYSFLFSGLTSANALVKGWTPPEENSVSPEAKGDNPLRIIIEPSDENQVLESQETMNELSMDDIFGDEQVFPFVAGLGKNSGKD